MRRRFFNSINKEETFTACEVTDDLISSMDFDQTDYLNQAIGTVIMWDYEEERFRAFIFDNLTLEASRMSHSGFKEYPKKQFLPFGILLYGKRQMQQIEHPNSGDGLFYPNSITCVSLLTYDYTNGNMILNTKDVAAAWGEYYRINATANFVNPILQNKYDSTRMVGDVKPLPRSMGTNDPLLQAKSQSQIAGYNVFQTTDAYNVLTGGLIQGANLGSISEDILYDTHDMRSEGLVFANNGYTGKMSSSSAMLSPFVSRNDEHFWYSWCCPDLNQDTYMYLVTTSAKATLEHVMFEDTLSKQNNYFLKTMNTDYQKLFKYKVGGYSLRIPTIYELRMMFARLGRISEVESELLNQSLITTPIATLFAKGSDGLGGVVLSATFANNTLFHYGIQGVTARLVTVSAVVKNRSYDYDVICIPFFRLASDSFI